MKLKKKWCQCKYYSLICSADPLVSPELPSALHPALSQGLYILFQPEQELVCTVVQRDAVTAWTEEQRLGSPSNLRGRQYACMGTSWESETRPCTGHWSQLWDSGFSMKNGVGKNRYFIGLLYLSVQNAQTKYHWKACLNNRSVSHSFGDWKS